MGQKILQAVCTRLAIAIPLLILSPAAFAYLDPSTGSMVVSALVGIVASIALAAKTYWYKIKRLFRHSSKPAGEPAKDSSEDQ